MRKDDDYEDIINLPHHVSDTHRHMSMYQRAAQFAPFAALTGFDDEIKDGAKEVAQGFDDDDAPDI